MRTCNLFEYSDNYSMTSVNCPNYYRDKLNYDTNKNNADNYKINNKKTTVSRSFKYKTKTIGSTPLITIH